MSYTNYSEYTNINPTEYALQTSMSQPNIQTQEKTQTQTQPNSQPNSLTNSQPNFQQQQSPSPNINSIYKQGLLSGLKNFLNIQTGTVLVFTICFCLGNAFKDLVQSIVGNIVQPLIIKLLLFTHIYNFSVVSDVISEKNSILNITDTFSKIITFIILLITVYLLFTLINTVK